MRVAGQPDMDYLSTRLSDVAGQQRVQVRVDYQVQGKRTSAFTDYVLQPGYALENDALGFGKALKAMSSSTPGTKPTVMPPAAIAGARQTMPDYAASAQFVATENVGGRTSDRYRYAQRHPGNPVQIETGEIWLSEAVPFGLVRQQAVTREESGKVVSSFEMLLVDSGTGAATAEAAARPGAAAMTPDARVRAGPVTLSDAFRNGQVELVVDVVPGQGGRMLRIKFRNKGEAALRLAVPAGATTLEAGTPLDHLHLGAGAAKVIEIAPGAVSPAVEFTQTGARRAVDGSFVLSVYEGTPLFSGSVTMDTVKR
jgi:hypothetical protein